MASEERDRKFDQALARHLRSAAPTEAARASASAATPQAGCPDAEILAAYHERALSLDEMNSWKEHIAGCGHCQTILAHLETTDEIPLAAAENEELVAAGHAAPELAGAPRAAEAMSSLGIPKVAEIRERVAARAKQSDLRFLHRPRWRWLAPAGAIAAALLVWIAMNENRKISVNKPSTQEVAVNRPAASPPPSAEPRLTSPALSADTATRSAPQETTVPNGRAVSKVQKDEKALARGDESKAAGAALPADEESRLRQGGERKSSEGSSRASREGALYAKSEPGAVVGGIATGVSKEKAAPPAVSEIQTAESGAAQQQSQFQNEAANSQVQNQVNSNVQRVPGPAPLGQANSALAMKKAATAKPAVPPAASAPAHGAAGYQAGAGASMDLIAASNLHLIPAPGAATIWRVGPAGSIELSKDGGASWSAQTSGVSVDLLAGSAPSEKICWVVGRAGTILFTNDGGAHWKTVNSPLAEDVGGARATDALHARIWDLHSTRFFVTSDGGQTWSRVPAQ